ncbi:hypothetical protein SVR5_01311 [Glaesserella parasuis 29755]|nr:hypothetical protein SVR5_01311 [Glaesserella parasuis 29755]
MQIKKTDQAVGFPKNLQICLKSNYANFLI